MARVWTRHWRASLQVRRQLAKGAPCWNVAAAWCCLLCRRVHPQSNPAGLIALLCCWPPFYTHAGGNPEAPTAALFAGDPGQLRWELLRRVKRRMDDRAQAGMQADPVRLSMPGFRSRYYQRCFGVEEPTGPELDKAVGS